MEQISNREHIQSYFENLPTEVMELIILLLDVQSMKALHSSNFGPSVTTAMHKATEITHKRLWSALQVHYAEHQQLVYQYTMVFKHNIDLEFEPIFSRRMS